MKGRMKTILTLAVCLAAALSLGACASHEETTSTTATTTSSTGYSK